MQQHHYGIWVLLAAVTAVWMGHGLALEMCPANSGINTCYYTNVAKLTPVTNSPVYAIGGLFDIYEKGTASGCGPKLQPFGVQLSQAFLWALDYWQHQVSPSSMPVAGVVFDTCNYQEQLIHYLIGFGQCNLRIQDIDRNMLLGFVGTTNADGQAAAKVTESMNLTVVSPSANSLLLDNKSDYPYYFSTTPSMQVDIDIIKSVLKKIGTNYVAAIYEQSEMVTFQAFESSMRSVPICVVNSLMVQSNNFSSIVSFLLGQEKTRYFALFMTDAALVRFISTVMGSDAVKRKNHVFLIPSSIKRTSSYFDGVNSVATENTILIEQNTPPTLTAAITAFQDYWGNVTKGSAPSLTQSTIDNPFLTQYISDTNRPQVPKNDPALASTIMAANVFVQGVFEAGKVACGGGASYLCSNFLNGVNRGYYLKENIQKSKYFTPDGVLLSSIFTYSVYSYLISNNFAKIGEYSGDNLNWFPASNFYTPGQCPASPCLACGEQPTTTPTPTTSTTSQACKPDMNNNQSSVAVLYPRDQEITGAYRSAPRSSSEFNTRFEVGQKWIIALGVLAGLGILSVLIFEIYILYKLLGTRMSHKWRTMWLGQLLLFGIFLCYLTLFAYLPIPTKATCGITRFGVGVSYSICFAVLLVKLMVILTSKTSENSLLPGDMESPNYLKGVYQFLMFILVVGVQVVIDTQWLITVPPEALKVKAVNGEDVWVCNHYTFRASGDMTNMVQFVRTEFENHVLSLVYIMFLILITTLLALSAHGIITNHRESVFIGIASGFSIPIWLAWTLVGGLNKSHAYAHEFGDGCIAFGLFLTATLLLFAMFLPKVRQLVSMGVEGIYFEDDRDTVYAGSVIMAPPSYKSRPNSVIYVNNQGIYSEPIVFGNGEPSYKRHLGSSMPTNISTYSAPAAYMKRGGDSTLRGGSVLRVTDDLSGRRPIEKKRTMSEMAYGSAGQPRSVKGTLPRSRSHTSLGAL